MSDTSAPQPPLRAIAARFTDDVAQTVLGNVLKERPFEFCAMITADARFPLPAGIEHEWFESGKIRGCEYEGVDWNALAPLDADILERMSDAEALFMDTVARLEWKRSIPYEVRHRWYLRHLRFWNDYLARKKINFFLSAWIPHEVPDVLLYSLCRARGIPTLYFHTTLVQDISFSASTVEDPAPRLRMRYAALLQRSAEIRKPEDVSLEPPFEERYRALTAPQGEKPRIENLHRNKDLERIKELFWSKPLRFFANGLQYLSPSGFHRLHGLLRRRRAIRERNLFYDAHAVKPDLDRPYVYLPLHFQPEASTTPMAGRFTDQWLVAQMLNACLPDNMLIYIKEHPRESGWMKRSREDYEDFLALKKVRLVSRETDTFQLRENCKAVATCTGSAGFEALFRGKPVLLFGSRFYQYARGVFRIQTVDDCRKAVQAVFSQGATPDPIGTRLFMKAIQETGVRAILHPLHRKLSRMPVETLTANMTQAILSELKLPEPEIAIVAA